MNKNRESGFYWVMTSNMQWQIAEYKSMEQAWHFTNGMIYCDDNALFQIDENIIKR